MGKNSIFFGFGDDGGEVEGTADDDEPPGGDFETSILEEKGVKLSLPLKIREKKRIIMTTIIKGFVRKRILSTNESGFFFLELSFLVGFFLGEITVAEEGNISFSQEENDEKEDEVDVSESLLALPEEKWYEEAWSTIGAVKIVAFFPLPVKAI